jgi:NAD(P)-dependent dehydrogenase (short-subunit alcohol dehydrogenase family)
MKGTIAVITGAASGIGLGIAEGLAQRGARVALADIDRAAAEVAASGLRRSGADAVSFGVDVSREADVEQLFSSLSASWGAPGILVNNAGIVRIGPSTELDLAAWEQVLSVNLSAVFLCSRAAARRMMAAGGGSIVNIASVAAIASAPGFAAYSASKGGVLSLTRALAVEWAPHNIRVNSVSPGTIDTPLSRAARERDPEGFARRDKRVPIRRAGTTQDVADAVAWLAGAESGYVTGQDIKVDGGIFAQHPGYVP